MKEFSMRSFSGGTDRGFIDILLITADEGIIHFVTVFKNILAP